MTEFTKYSQLMGQGASAVEVLRRAEADGLDQITRIRMVREVFRLSLIEAKAVSVEARSGSSLEEQQARFVEGLNKALKSEE